MAKSRTPKDPIDRMRQALDKGGLKGLETATARVRKQAEAALVPYQKLAGAVADPRLRRAMGEALAVAESARRLNSLARERVSLEARRAAVVSGEYARELRAKQLLAKETEKVLRLEQRAQYQARLGRVGGTLAYHAHMLAQSPLVRAGMAAAGGAGVAATGLAVRGFGGTVEMNRLNLEVQMISREMAGSFRPAIEFATRALQMFRKFLERFGQREQNMLMLGGLALGGLGAIGLGRLALGGLGIGGMAAAGAGGGLAGRALGLGALAPFAVGGLASAAGYRHEVIGAGAAFGAARAAMGTPPAGLTRLGAARAGAVRLAAPIAAGAAVYEAGTGGYYSELRARGTSRVGSAFGALGGGFMDLVSLGRYGEEFRKRRGSGTGPFSSAAALAAAVGSAGGPDPTRRMVTIADAGFESPGSAFERITNRLALVDASEEPKKDAADLLAEIKNFLTATFGGTPTPPPPPMPTP